MTRLIQLIFILQKDCKKKKPRRLAPSGLRKESRDVGALDSPLRRKQLSMHIESVAGPDLGFQSLTRKNLNIGGSLWALKIPRDPAILWCSASRSGIVVPIGGSMRHPVSRLRST